MANFPEGGYDGLGEAIREAHRLTEADMPMAPRDLAYVIEVATLTNAHQRYYPFTGGSAIAAWRIENQCVAQEPLDGRIPVGLNAYLVYACTNKALRFIEVH